MLNTTKRLLKKIRLRTWIAFGIVLVLLPIVLFKLLYKEEVQAASMTVEESTTQIIISVPNRYNAVLQKGDTVDYILFYDRVQSDGAPSPTHEIQGPCITETAVFCLRDDAFRTTTILEQSPMRVRIRVQGRFNNEASTDYLDDDSAVFDLTVMEDYTFTPEGVFVRNILDNGVQDGLTFDADSAHNGYEWLGVWADVTDAGFDDTGNIIYGDGNTEATTTTDAAELANTNIYVVMPGTGSDTYQDAVVGIPRGGWFDNADVAGTHEWHWDEANTGTQDLIAAQEQVYDNTRTREARWFFLLKNEDDLDTEAEREALANMYRNPDILSYTTGSDRYEEPIGSSGIFADNSPLTYIVTVGDVATYDFGDTADFSVEAWLRKDNLGGNDSVLIGKRTGASPGTGAGWQLYFEDTTPADSIIFAVGDSVGDGSSTYSLTSTTTIVSDKWYHIAVVFDQDNAANTTMYINGVDDAPTKTGVIGDIGSLSNAIVLNIGSAFDGNNVLNGWIDEARVWDDVRTSTEINENMHHEIDPASSNLIGYWRFNEGYGLNTEELSATNADGTLLDAEYWSTGKVPAKYNTAEATYSTQTTSKSTQVDIDAGSNVSTSLTATLADNAATVTVGSTTGFPSSGTAYINGDKFTYGGTTATTFTSVTTTGENAVDNHASGEVVSLFNRVKPTFKIGGFKGVDAPSFASLEGATINKGNQFDAQVKPIANAYFQQDISYYIPLSSATVDIGTTFTNSGCTFTDGPQEFITTPMLCNADSENGEFTLGAVGTNIDFVKGAMEFVIQPISIHTDGVERTYFNIGPTGTPNEQFRFRKTSGNALEFLIDEGDTSYTESMTSSEYSWDLGTNVHIRLEWDDAAVNTADQMKIIINGTQTSTTDSGNFDGSIVTGLTGIIFVGNDAAAGTVECNCTMSHFTIFDYNGGNSTNKLSGGKAGLDAFGGDSYNYTLSFGVVDASNRGEYLYLGTDTKVNGFNIDLATNGATAGTLNLDWEYWNGTTWTSLESISGFTDNTGNFTRSGSVYWTTPPSGWKRMLVGNNVLNYYIRASLNSSSGTYTTSPIENKATTDVLEFQYLSTLTSADQTFIIPTQTVASLHWSMDEGQGTVISDGTGNKNEGNITNALWRTEDLCISGKCLEFDGSGDYVSRGDDDDLDTTATESFTISSWFRHPDIVTNPDYLIAKHHTTGTDGGYKMYMNADGTVTCAIDDDSTFGPEDSTSSTAILDDNKWHHASCVKNASSSLTLYIDGKQVGTPDVSFAATGTLANSDTFYLGIDGDGSSNGWDGFIDEFKYYPYARSANEVTADYVKGSAGNRGSSAVFGAQDTAFLNDGLVGYWALDETTAGASATDKSGNGNTLTDVGTTARAGGKFGNAADFENSVAGSDYLEVASNPTSLDITSSVTISAWLKPESGCSNCDILGKTSSGSGGYFFYFGGSATTVRFSYYSPTQFITESAASTISNGTWVHVVGVHDNGSDTDRIYINGVLSTESTGRTSNPATTTSDLELGGTNSFHGEYDGIQEDVRVYNRALSPAEVRSLYNWAPGPVGYWKLDENTGTTANDFSANANTGTITAGTGGYTIGKFGAAYNFDNANTSINAGSGTTLDNLPSTAGITLDAWIYPTSQGEGSAGVIMAKNVGTTPSAGWLLQFAGTNALTFTVDGSTDLVRTTSNSVITANTWNHVAVSWDGIITTAASVRIYVNGSEVTYATTTNGAARVDDGTSTFFIGNDSTSARTFDGRIDDARAYNYPRTAQQIVEDMNGGHPFGGSPIGSQAVWWKFDEQTGTTAQDLADATQSDGTISGANWLTSTSCKMNGCLNFDAAAEVVTVATASDTEVDFNASEKFSLSAWIYVVTSPGASDEDIIIGKWDETAAAELRAYRLYITDADTDNTINLVGELYDESANQTLSAATTNEPLALNTWYHVVFTHNGGIAGAAGDIETYINGKSVATNSANASFLGVDDVASDFTVGDYDATDAFAGNTTFAGRIDDVQVYSDELTADQVKIVMNAGATSAFSVLSSTSEEADVAGSQGNPPVGWWKMDENNGTTANDTSGNGFNATLTNSPTWQPGKMGSGLSMGASTSQHAIYDDVGASALDQTSSFTVEAWVKFNALTAENQIIVLKSANGTVHINWFIQTGYISGSTLDEIELGYWTASGTAADAILTSGVNLTTNTWYHITGVFDDTANTVTAYVNGAQVAQSTGAVDTPITGDADFYIGNYFAAGWGPPDSLNGTVDEIKFYNYARSQAQIAYNYNRGGPVGWWKMDDCTATTVNDLSIAADLGFAKDGTWSGAGGTNTSAGTCTVVDTATAWYNGRNGKYGSSLDFDGVDDVVTVTNTDTIDLDVGLNNGFTIAGWVNADNAGEGSTGQIINKGTNTYLRVDTLSGSNLDVEANLDYTTADANVNVSTAITTSTWYHIALTFNSTANTISIWVNGQNKGTSGAGTGGKVADTSNLFVGNNSGGTLTFDGRIDDVRIFPYQITTAAQMGKIMNEGSGARFGPVTGSP